MLNFWSNSYIKYESNGDRNKNLLVKECLNKIKPYSRDIIIDLQKSGTWKVQLTTAINFIFFRDEERVMHSKGSNKGFMIYDDANYIVDELFNSLLSRY